MDKAKIILFLRLITQGAALFIVAASIVTATFVDRSLKNLSLERLDQTVDLFSDEVTNRMEHYADILYSSRSYILNKGGEVSQEEWDRFFRDQETLERYPGISTVTYLDFFDESQKETFLRSMRLQDYFGAQKFSIKPEGTRSHYAVVKLVSSKNDVKSSFGFDVYSGKPQRMAMDLAIKTGKPQATEPYTLATGFGGFAAFLPVYQNAQVEGFSLLSFRTDDFIKAVFPEHNPGLRYKITDTTDPKSPKPLYSSDDWREEDQLERSDTVTVLGRTWQLTYAADRDYNVSQFKEIVPALIMAIGTLVSAPLFIASYVFMRSGKHSKATKTL